MIRYFVLVIDTSTSLSDSVILTLQVMSVYAARLSIGYDGLREILNHEIRIASLHCLFTVCSDNSHCLAPSRASTDYTSWCVLNDQTCPSSVSKYTPNRKTKLTHTD